MADSNLFSSFGDLRIRMPGPYEPLHPPPSSQGDIVHRLHRPHRKKTVYKNWPRDSSENPHANSEFFTPPTSPAKPSPTTSIVDRLPPELYRVMVQSIPPSSAVLLSLTCKSLWARVHLKSSDVLYRLQRCSHLDETMYFLNMLEVDSPKAISCSVCLQLHNRLPAADEADELIRKGDRSYGSFRPCTGEQRVVRWKGPTDKQMGVFREGVELVLRRAQLGSEYGLPIDCLRQHIIWKVYGASRMTVNFETRAVIIKKSMLTPGGDDPAESQTLSEQQSQSVILQQNDGEGELSHLLIRATYKVEVDLRRDLETQIDQAQLGGCTHMQGSEQVFIIKRIKEDIAEQMKGHGDSALSKLSGLCISSRPTTNAQGLSPIAPKTSYRCSDCPTDLFVGAVYTYDEVYARVIMMSYRDLGPRGDHRARVWQAQASKSYGALRFDRSNGYAFGHESLRGLWKRAKSADGPKIG